ncbi:MAG: formylglycine-generating enzyme family protein, partial [Flavobacteriales bacterium]|nr:formylglycine-generating enzyme family protein [Flavobacteriales bacterium]
MFEQLKTICIITITAILVGCCNNEYNISSLKKINNKIKDTTISNIELVYVPKGSFKYGINCEERLINYDFWIGKYEITNLQYYNFLIDAKRNKFITIKDGKVLYKFQGDSIVRAGYYNVKMWDEGIYLLNDSIKLNHKLAKHPVVRVTWYGCLAFCNFYGFNLPKETEWEKAARGNECRNFPWGDKIDSTYANYLNSNDPFEPGTTPVGFYNGQIRNSFKTSNSRSFYGCYDMSGNSWEWVEDYYENGKVPFHKGKGGGYNYHFPAFLQIYYVSIYGPFKRPPLD